MSILRRAGAKVSNYCVATNVCNSTYYVVYV